MTCIVSIRYKSGWLMVGDTQSSAAETCFNITNGVDGKMFRGLDDNKAIFGHTGDAHNISIIKHIPHLTDDYAAPGSDFNYEYVATKMMPKIRNYFAKLHLISKPTNKFQTNLLVAKGDKCFNLYESGSVLEVKDFMTIGSGSLAALGSLRGTIHEKDPLKRAIKAVDAATKYDIYCSYPIQIASTNKDTYYVLTKAEAKEVLEGKKELDL